MGTWFCVVIKLIASFWCCSLNYDFCFSNSLCLLSLTMNFLVLNHLIPLLSFIKTFNQTSLSQLFKTILQPNFESGKLSIQRTPHSKANTQNHLQQSELGYQNCTWKKQTKFLIQCLISLMVDQINEFKFGLINLKSLKSIYQKWMQSIFNEMFDLLFLINALLKWQEGELTDLSVLITFKLIKSNWY